MNAFKDASKVEKRSMDILMPMLEPRYDGRLVLTNKGRLSREVQEKYGDIFVQHATHGLQSIEVKAEEQNEYGNFYIEEWSNRKWFNRGWLDKLDCDLLLYHFLREDDLYVLNFANLKRWAYQPFGERGRSRIESFRCAQQAKRTQLNDTWGACVPIAVLEKEVGFILMHPAREFAAETTAPAAAPVPWKPKTSLELFGQSGSDS